VKRAYKVIGFLVACVALVVVGLIPGENIIAADSSPDESYTLDGVARFAMEVTALCEFTLGVCLAFGICYWNRRKTEQLAGAVGEDAAAQP